MKEKDSLVKEIQETVIPLSENFEQQVNANDLKEIRLNSLKTEVAKKQQDLKKLRQNSKFTYQIKNIMLSKTSESLQNEIQEIESNLKGLCEMSYPQKRTQILKTSFPSDIQYLKLMDLKFHRLEELAYGKKKRLNAVEQSDDISDEIIQKYGGLTNMLAEYNVLDAENKSLRSLEISFINDALTRRRLFHHLSVSSNRSIIQLLRHAILCEMDMLENMAEMQLNNFYEKSNEHELNEVVNDQFFEVEPNQFDLAEFGNTFEQEIIDSFMEAETTTDRKNELLKLMQITKQTNDKIESELESMSHKLKLIIPTGESAAGRSEQVSVDTFSFLERYAKLGDQIESQLIDNDDILQKIGCALSVRRIHGLEVVLKTAKLRDLNNDHIKLLKSQAQNVSNLQTLLHVACVQALKLNNAPSTVTEQYVFQTLNDLAVQAAIAQATASVTSRDQDSTRSGGSHYHLRKKKGPKARLHSERTEHVSPIPIPIENPFSESTPVEFFHCLCYMVQLSGFSIGIDYPFLKHFKMLYQELTDDFKEYVFEQMKPFEIFTKSNHMIIKHLSNHILIKSKTDAEVQTFEPPVEDVETQYEEIPPPQASKQPAKPKKKSF